MSEFDEGFKARQRGEPYRPVSKAWSDGWRDLDEHLRNRDEALASIGWFGTPTEQKPEG